MRISGSSFSFSARSASVCCICFSRALRSLPLNIPVVSASCCRRFGSVTSCINPYAHKFKEQYYTYKFLKENNIKIIETATTNSKILKRFKVVNDFYEQTAKNLHLMLPTLNHTEIETLSIVYTILEILNKVNNTKNAKLLIETWLISNTECSIDNFEELTPEWCRGFILHYTQIDEQRQKQKK